MLRDFQHVRPSDHTVTVHTADDSMQVQEAFVFIDQHIVVTVQDYDTMDITTHVFQWRPGDPTEFYLACILSLWHGGGELKSAYQYYLLTDEEFCEWQVARAEAYATGEELCDNCYFFCTNCTCVVCGWEHK